MLIQKPTVRLGIHVILALCILPPLLFGQSRASLDSAAENRNPSRSVRGQGETVFISLGDSLTHGTMDGTNNSLNTLHAYAQLIADSLGQVVPLQFVQPLFDENQDRIDASVTPTNLGVDGADIYSAEGLSYYKTIGADTTDISKDYICDARSPRRFDTKYDKVLYPINREAHQDVSQIDAAVQLLGSMVTAKNENHAIVTVWLGNNDSSTAALGEGGANPEYIPVPVDAIQSELSPALRLLFRVAERQGIVSFDSYTQASIERNMTDISDFTAQYNHVVDRLMGAGNLDDGSVDIFLLSLPYYSSIAYLMDSEDIEYYLRKFDPAYSVPPTFKRVAPDGQPISDPLAGDRISLLTFGMMYTLLGTGHTSEEVNRVLEIDGAQQDGMVLSEAEQRFISTRIDAFNAVIQTAATSRGSHVHFVNVGQYMNDALNGSLQITVGDRTINRKWTRGNGFTLDGVHPGYTAQAFIANFVLADINAALNLNAPAQDVESIFVTDPYIDRDGDGFAPGPHSPATGIAKLLYLLTDSDDSNASVSNVLPDDVWDQISSAILQEVLGFAPMRREAESLGIQASK